MAHFLARKQAIACKEIQAFCRGAKLKENSAVEPSALTREGSLKKKFDLT